MHKLDELSYKSHAKNNEQNSYNITNIHVATFHQYVATPLCVAVKLNVDSGTGLWSVGHPEFSSPNSQLYLGGGRLHVPSALVVLVFELL